MLYTNKQIELMGQREGLTAILSPLYYAKGGLFIGADLVLNEDQTYITQKFHKGLTIETSGDRLNIVEKKDDELYIIIDTMEYKFFSENGRVGRVSTDEETEVVFSFTLPSRTNCSSDIVIFKVPKNKPSIYKLVTTARKASYIVVHNGFVNILSKEYLLDYAAKYNLNLPDVDSLEWIIMKK